MSVSGADTLAQQTDYTQGSLGTGDSFARSSTASYYNASGVLQALGAGSGVARFDYSPSTLTARGLLLEATDTNAGLYSNTFSNAYWTKNYASDTLNSAAGTSPDGTNNSWSLIAGSGSSIAHSIYESGISLSSVTSGGYFKANAGTSGYSDVNINCNTSSTIYGVATFNIANGSVTSVQTSGGVVTSGYPSIIYVGNGWYKVSASFSGLSGTGGCSWAISDTDTPTLTIFGQRLFVGNGTGGIYAYGFQRATNAISSYMTTTSGSFTRAADALSNTSYAFGTYSVVVEWQNEASQQISRTYYAAGTMGSTVPTGYWLRRLCVYPAAADVAYLANQAANIGQACY
jgi:hypothetical protein